MFIDNAQLYSYKYKHYFHAHIVIHISIKVNIIHIFIWTFTHSITFLHGRFVYIHTFFHRQIMWGCRLATCLYDIRQTSYERIFHHGHVAPSVPIWTEFTSHQGHLYSRQILRQIGACGLRWLEDSVSTSTAMLLTLPRRAIYIIYIWGKIENHLNYTYANARDFYTLHR